MNRRLFPFQLLRIIALTLPVSACTSLFFHPSTQPGLFPSDAGLLFEEVLFEGEQGELYGWWLPAQGNADGRIEAAKGTVVFAHGNAGNVSSHLSFVYWLPKQGYNVFMFDYRGYGRSDGEPSAEGLVDDTQRAIRYVRQRNDMAGDVVLYGHSLGGATGLSALATLDDRQHIKGAIIDSAFSSYRGIARDKVASHWLTAILYPFVPLMITGQPKPDQLIQALSPLPVYISHSSGDQVIPVKHGRQLFERAQPPKYFYALKAQQHNHGWQHADDRRWFLNALQEMFAPASY